MKALHVPRRVMYVANAGWFFISHRLPIAIAAKAAGDEVHVAVAMDPELDKDSRRTLEAAGFIVHSLQLSRHGAHPYELIRDWLSLIRLFQGVRPDIAHLVTLKPILLGGLACRLVRIPATVMAVPGRGTVFSARGPLAMVRRWIVLIGYRLAYRHRKTRVIVQNVEDRDYFVSRRIFRAEDVSLIRGSGVDTSRFAMLPEPNGPPIVVFAGRMLREKGAEEFVAAAASLKQQQTPARFVLLGAPDHGNPKSHTREEIEAWVASGAVEWWGFCHDMERVFAQSHIVCLPTYYGEGVPKVLIEAAAAGRPIITTNTPGCRDIVRHEFNGLLVPPRDTASLVLALERLINNADERRAMGERGHRLARAEFAVELVVEKTLNLYASIAR
jgi:glycosyltransferase involved in cell wall biosynthesis